MVSDEELEAFFANVLIADAGCWVWIGTRRNGYSLFRGEFGHRWSVRHLLGEPLVAGWHVDHLCHQPLCVNPGHLEQVTPGENIMRSARTLPYKNSRKAFCPQQHPLVEGNLYRYDYRRCRTCSIAKVQRYRARLRAERESASQPQHQQRPSWEGEQLALF